MGERVTMTRGLCKLWRLRRVTALVENKRAARNHTLASPASFTRMRLLRAVVLLLVTAAALAAFFRRAHDGPGTRKATASRQTQEWTRIPDCRLVENRWNDGDSFRVQSRGKEHLLRLYFVDAPELDDSFPDRVQQQADYFGISREEVLSVGRRASAFTRQQLGAGPFVVHTRWRKAAGRSYQPRHYAWVEVRGRDLNELLVEAGLARIYGTRVTLPDGRDSRAYLRQLSAAERVAKRLRKGAWGKSVELNGALPERARRLDLRASNRWGIPFNFSMPMKEPPELRVYTATFLGDT